MKMNLGKNFFDAYFFVRYRCVLQNFAHYLHHVCLSVCLSVQLFTCNNSRIMCRIRMEFDFGMFYHSWLGHVTG